MITYIIFECIEIDKINFNEVFETSKNTLRLSNNKLLTFINYEIKPAFVDSLTTIKGVYNYDEIFYLLNNDENWKFNFDIN